MAQDPEENIERPRRLLFGFTNYMLWLTPAVPEVHGHQVGVLFMEAHLHVRRQRTTALHRIQHEGLGCRSLCPVQVPPSHLTNTGKRPRPPVTASFMSSTAQGEHPAPLIDPHTEASPHASRLRAHRESFFTPQPHPAPSSAPSGLLPASLPEARPHPPPRSCQTTAAS